MKKKTLLLSIMIILLSGCSDNKNRPFDPTEKLTLSNPTIIDISENTINPYDIEAYGEYVAFLDWDLNKYLKLYNSKGEFIDSYAHKGKAPNEFLMVNSIDIFEIDGITNIGLQDFNGRKYSKMPLKDDETFSKQFDYKGMIPYMKRISDGNFIASTTSDTASFILLDHNGTPLDKIINLPPKPEGVSEKVHAFIMSMPLIASSRNSANFISTTQYDGGLDFFAVKDDKIEHKWRFSQFNMDYDAGEYGSPTANINSRTAYTQLDITKDKVYALFTNVNHKEESGYSGNIIHVFNYDGDHLQEITIDQKVIYMAIDENNERLYCTIMDEDENQKLLIYNL